MTENYLFNNEQHYNGLITDLGLSTTLAVCPFFLKKTSTHGHKLGAAN